MKCEHCGGRLEGNLTQCPFCGTRQDIDLKGVHFRDLGHEGSLPCPGCEATLGVIEFDTDPAIRIERCGSCLGLFFNPGELEALLAARTNPIVWLDRQRLDEIKANYGFNHEVVYLKCPICRERMSHHNFGHESGVILDRCGVHGYWLQGGELKRLLEWWHAGGKVIYQERQPGHRALMRENSRRTAALRWNYPRAMLEHPVGEERSRLPGIGEAVSNTVMGLLAFFAD